MELEDWHQKPWYHHTATRQHAESYLEPAIPGTFIVRPSSKPACLALSHKFPNGEIGHTLVIGSQAGWTISGTELFFTTVEKLLRSRKLVFPEDNPSYPPPNPLFQQNALPVGIQQDAVETDEAYAEAEQVVADCATSQQTILELFSMSLTRVPPSLQTLTHVQQLILSNNELKSFPYEICYLVNLKTLWIQNNQIQSLPGDIGYLVKLEKLKLSHNQMQGTTGFPQQLVYLTSLREIWLEENSLDVFPANLLLVTSLRRVWMDHNSVRTIPSKISAWTGVDRLSLTHNQLAVIPPELCRLPSLERLYLSNNELRSLPVEIKELACLHTLTLDNNQITSFSALDPIRSRLQELKFDGNPGR